MSYLKSYPVCLVIVVCGVGFIFGAIFGHLLVPRFGRNYKDYYEENGKNPINSFILNEMKADSIREFVKFLTQTHRLAGSEENEEMAHKYRKLWLEQGLDDAYLVPYDVFVSNSNRSHPNKVYIINSVTNETVFTSKHEEVPLHEGDSKGSNSVHAFFAYSPNGDVTGDPVYVNRGDTSDFEYLEDNGVNVKDKICLMKSFRGFDEAAKKGCLGIIIFSAPERWSIEGTDPLKVYPNSRWMPGTAIQKISLLGSIGDPSTPGYPSIAKVKRLDRQDYGLPTIPVQPIGSDDAIEILKRMGGIEFNSTWTGFFNGSYNVGPGFNDENKHLKLRLVVNNESKIKTIHNVIGVIKGELEPDRYVMIGSHRDSVGLGASDPASGGSSILEVSRVFGLLRKRGWKPRRTIIFCNWDAEELGIIGSTEYVEEHVDMLQQRAVSYINADTCVKGSRFSPEASLSLNEFVKNATKLVPDPDNSQRSLFDRWLERDPAPNHTDPAWKSMRGSSDHYAFAFFAGIPSININYLHDKEKAGGDYYTYPAYHTGYETLYYVDNFIDPGFVLHQGCARLLGVMVHALADRTLVPYDFETIANHISKTRDFIEKENLEWAEEHSVDQWSLLSESVSNFSRAAEVWKSHLNIWENISPLTARQVNDVMMSVQKSFISPTNTSSSIGDRMLLFKGGRGLPTVFDKWLDIKISKEKNATDDEISELEEMFAEELTDLALRIRSVANLLETSINLLQFSGFN